MNNPLFKYAIADYHSTYMACAQGVNWCPEAFANISGANGFIVQEIYHERIIDSKMNYSVQYYEAWTVEKGKCNKEKGQICDDLFSVGYPLWLSDSMRDSIGHSGIVAYHPKLYWVSIDSDAFSMVNEWKNGTVYEANGLKSILFSKDVQKALSAAQSYNREEFIHGWDFRDPTIIYEEILSFCKKNWNPSKKVDKSNFEICIDDIFSKGKYLDAKQRIIEDWLTCAD